MTLWQRCRKDCGCLRGFDSIEQFQTEPAAGFDGYNDRRIMVKPKGLEPAARRLQALIAA